MTTLNGIPRSLDSCIQDICARRKLISFNRIREECAQEEAILVTREEKMGSIDDQVLTIHTRNKFKKTVKKEKFHHNKKKDNKQKKAKEILQMFDATLVMKREILQETVP